MQSLCDLVQHPIERLFHGGHRPGFFPPLNNGTGQRILIFQRDEIQVLLGSEKIRREHIGRQRTVGIHRYPATEFLAAGIERLHGKRGAVGFGQL